MKDIPKEIVLILVVIYAVLLIIQSYMVLNLMTGRATTGQGIVSLCVNAGPPAFVTPLDCPANITVGQVYFCDLDFTEPDNDNVTFTDNSSLFVIGAKTGIITFSPSLSAIGEQSANITAKDSTDCDNNKQSTVINFTVLKPVCGNGFIDPGESCDDGNVVSGDGCSSACQLEVAKAAQAAAEGGQTGGAAEQKAETSPPSPPAPETPSSSSEASSSSPSGAASSVSSQTALRAGAAPRAPPLAVPLGKAFDYQANLLQAVPPVGEALGVLAVLSLTLGAYAFSSLNLFSVPFSLTSIASKVSKNLSVLFTSQMPSVSLQQVRTTLLDLSKALNAKDAVHAKNLYNSLTKTYNQLTKKEQASVYKEVLSLYKKIEELVKK